MCMVLPMRPILARGSQPTSAWCIDQRQCSRLWTRKSPTALYRLLMGWEEEGERREEGEGLSGEMLPRFQNETGPTMDPTFPGMTETLEGKGAIKTQQPNQPF